MDWDPNELTAEQREEVAAAYRKHMIYGVLWIAGGAIVTVATISAGKGGIIAWGAMLFGAFDFFRGFSGWMKYK